VWFGGIAAAVFKQLPTRGYRAERRQARRLPIRAYARWHLKRGEGDGTEAWERDRKLLGTYAHKTRPEAPPEKYTVVGTPTRRRRRGSNARTVQPHAVPR
jgi:hypothetical protein